MEYIGIARGQKGGHRACAWGIAIWTKSPAIWIEAIVCSGRQWPYNMGADFMVDSPTNLAHHWIHIPTLPQSHIFGVEHVLKKFIRGLNFPGRL